VSKSNKTTLSSHGTVTLFVNVYQSIEFPLLLHFCTSKSEFPRLHSNLCTIPSLSQSASQIVFFLFVQFTVLRSLVSISTRLHGTKGGEIATRQTGTAYDISYKVISVRAAFLIGLYVMGAPGRLTLRTGSIHGIVVAVWMVIQQYLVLREDGRKGAQ
jgi:hypothetical protein